MMIIKKTILASVIATLGLVGCGSQSQDGGSNSSADANYAPGVAVDGPVVRGTVFIDKNNNLKLDSFEPSALTDNDGYFNKNRLTKTDYCSTEKTQSLLFSTFEIDSRPEFCLDVSQLTTTDTIIVTGGYDLYTGEPFEGSMYVSGLQAAFIAKFGVAITPLSSMLGAFANLDPLVGISDDIQAIVDLGLGINLLDPEDPEGNGQADNFQAYAFATTYSLHKFVTVYAAWIKRAYPEIGADGNDLPEDVSNLVYKYSLYILRGDDNAAFTAIQSDLEVLYQEAGVTFHEPLFNTSVLNSDINVLAGAIDSAFGDTPKLGALLTFDNVKARVRAVEVVVSRIIRGQEASAALGALSNATYLANLAGNGADNGNLNFTQLVEFEGDTAGLVAESSLAASASGVSLSNLAGKSLRFEDTDSDITSNAAIFFEGEDGETKGNIHLCLQYEDPSDSNATLEGDYISGNWDTIAALNNTVLLDMDVFGGSLAALKNVGDDGNGATEYRFDYLSKVVNFTSAQNLEVTADLNLDGIPKTDEACKVYLGITGA
jgi:hypothetical protein